MTTYILQISYVGKQNLISSTNHTVRIFHTRKVGLTAFDTKRWLCENTVHTHSHGHKDTVSNPSEVGIPSHNDLPGTTPLPDCGLTILSAEL